MEAKKLSHKRIHKNSEGDRKMKHPKRDTASGVSSNQSNIARAMLVRMPKVPPNLMPPEIPIQPEASSGQQNTVSEVIIAPPPINQPTEQMLTSTFAPLEALHQVVPRSKRGHKKVQNIMDFEMTIHPAIRQIRAQLILHSPAGNLVRVMPNPCNVQLSKQS